MNPSLESVRAMRKGIGCKRGECDSYTRLEGEGLHVRLQRPLGAQTPDTGRQRGTYIIGDGVEETSEKAIRIRQARITLANLRQEQRLHSDALEGCPLCCQNVSLARFADVPTQVSQAAYSGGESQCSSRTICVTPTVVYHQTSMQSQKLRAITADHPDSSLSPVQIGTLAPTVPAARNGARGAISTRTRQYGSDRFGRTQTPTNDSASITITMHCNLREILLTLTT